MKAEMTRTHVVKFRLSDGEKNYIETKFKASGKKSLSDYLRLQAIYGKVFLVDESYFIEMKRQLAGACSNINQIAYIANRTQNISAKELEDVRKLKREIENTFEAVRHLQGFLEGQSWQ
jgi:hypothetical protein